MYLDIFIFSLTSKRLNCLILFSGVWFTKLLSCSPKILSGVQVYRGSIRSFILSLLSREQLTEQVSKIPKHSKGIKNMIS